VEQLLEIIFTLLTVNVPCEEAEAPAPVDPAPALPLALPEVEPLGLAELAPGPLEPALPLASEPLIRT